MIVPQVVVVLAVGANEMVETVGLAMLAVIRHQKVMLVVVHPVLPAILLVAVVAVLEQLVAGRVPALEELVV
jgi:hypothetical protein